MEFDFLSPVLLAALQAEAPHPRRLLRPRSTLGRGVGFSRFLALARVLNLNGIQHHPGGEIGLTR